MEKQADIGLIGLAVMGENLVLNMERHGFSVVVYNRTPAKTEAFLAGRGKGKNIFGTNSIADFIKVLKKPRRVIMLVKAGAAVDSLIEQILPHLEAGDIIIDGGNTHYTDTIRRTAFVESKGFLYCGTGVSGGEEGALNGPSIMPGGSPKAWQHVGPVFQAIAAKADDGSPCCDWVGDGGAGHFVKMVHNGIEYGDMQLIGEAYHLLKDLLGLSNEEMHAVFKQWNKGDLDSYLIEITRDILIVKDEQGEFLVNKILDSAGQKGTGKWTATTAIDLGVPLTLISEAVSARNLSALKQERVVASNILKGPQPKFQGDHTQFITDLSHALFASKIVSYAQGYALMRAVAQEYKWNLNYGAIAQMWRGGCIIRSVFLEKITRAFTENPNLTNLLLAPFFKEKLEAAQTGWRNVLATAVLNGIPTPSMSAALTYYDGYRCEKLPANLLQAQRDYFGAHTYEREDQPRGKYFHTNWTGRGGTTASTTYNA